MCDKAVLENGRQLKSVPDCYKNQEMCNKAVDNYPHILEFVPVIKQFIDIFLYLILFQINIKLKKYVTLLLLYIHL